MSFFLKVLRVTASKVPNWSAIALCMCKIRIWWELSFIGDLWMSFHRLQEHWMEHLDAVFPRSQSRYASAYTKEYVHIGVECWKNKWEKTDSWKPIWSLEHISAETSWTYLVLILIKHKFLPDLPVIRSGFLTIWFCWNIFCSALASQHHCISSHGLVSSLVTCSWYWICWIEAEFLQDIW